MTALELLERHKDELLALCERHHARNLRVFGSVARGEERPDSDVDLMVDWDDGASLIDWTALQREAGELLGKRVDLVDGEHLHWYIRDRVLAEAKPVS